MLMAPERLYTAAETAELDRRAIEDHGIAGHELMNRAGSAAFRLLRLRWPGARSVAVFSGGGNNGGDGLVVARLARTAGLAVRLALKDEPQGLGGAARRAWLDWDEAGGRTEALADVGPEDADVVIDALLGTGLDRPVRGAIAEAIGRINAAGRPVIAIDIPSGLGADTGAVLGDAVRAAATVTFIGAKRGLYTAAGPDHTGPVFLDTLDVPPGVWGRSGGVAVIGADEPRRSLPRRRPAAHKGDSGRLLVVGGDHGFAGAARLAAEAALRMGAGLVTVATRAAHAPALAAARPEIMARGVEDPAAELPALLAAADAVVAGPGLGRDAWARAVMAALQAAPAPLLLDADALNTIAAGPALTPAAAVVTPHPGEAARLLASDGARVQADRFAATDALVRRYRCTAVLKGAGTLVLGPDGETAILPGGNPALAAGGTGDVLAGVIGALLAAGLAPATAARCGVWLHGQAARRVAAERGPTLLASDLAGALGQLRDRPGDG